MMNMVSKHKLRGRLLLEGRDDALVVANLCESHDVPELFELKKCEGIDRLLDKFRDDLKADENLETLGIVIDADLDFAARWGSLRNTLSDNGFIVSDEMPKNGLVIPTSDKVSLKVGIWIMPNNSNIGMLEDFLLDLVPASDRLLEFAGKILDEIEFENKNNSIDNLYNPELHRAKAKIHTWLAWQKEPGSPLGLAITKRYLAHDSATLESFIDWIRELFIS